MPKKKNFLGGMQNYNPNTGEYEPDLKGPHGESPDGFKSFKKEKSEFEKFNAKRMGKAKEYSLDNLPKVKDTVKIAKEFGDNSREFEVVDVKDEFKGITIKEKGRDGITYKVDVSQLEGYTNKPLDGKIFGSQYSDTEDVNDINISQDLDDHTWQIDDNTTVGEYAQNSAERLGISKEKVLDIIKKEAPKEFDENTKMAELINDEVGESDDVEQDEDYERSWGHGKDDEEDFETVNDKRVGKEKAEKPNNKQYEEFLEKGKSTWNQKLSKGDVVKIKDKFGNEKEAYINGFWYQSKLQNEDTYEEGKDNLWHDFRAINLVDENGNEIGNINAFQILDHKKGSQPKKESKLPF